MMDIEKCITSERRKWSNLLEVDDGTPDFFDDLARRTARAVPESRVFWPKWRANSAFTPSSGLLWGINSYSLPNDLLDEWRGYAERWQHLLELNPRMRIAAKMSDVSEDHLAPFA